MRADRETDKQTDTLVTILHSSTGGRAQNMSSYLLIYFNSSMLLK